MRTLRHAVRLPAALALAVLAGSCSSSPTESTVPLRLNVAAPRKGSVPSTVVYVALRGGKSRTIGRVSSRTSLPDGLTQLVLHVATSQRIPDTVVADICTNHVKLQPEFRDGPPYLQPNFVVPVSRTLVIPHAC